ncbi:6-phosphofructokinase [Hesseltinella vesiculosa]|uniref:ATP-dependent 6-phosphofructokinase n=1 Tax=Hesseltinella vesiculosa TaxID=101127 RepID=A0A1X2GNS6_9FUNG|nr:6-phosphofructokinase [Hesseltinella vesiculosa]
MGGSEGFSHIVYHVDERNVYEQTRQFYEALGFKHVLKEREDSDVVSWLVFETSDTFSGNVTIHLMLSTENVCRNHKPLDQLADACLVFRIENADLLKAVLDQQQVKYKDRSSKDGKLAEIHVVDPMENRLIFTNRPAYPNLIDFTPTPITQVSGAPAPGHAPLDVGLTPKSFAILTSGGDCSGMNPAVRAAVRYGIAKGCNVYGIYEGYQGLVDGGKYIRKMDWKSVRGWLSVGGTSIGTARCMAFKTREGRLSAAENLVKHGIDSLIVCGGDGSLTGADVFRSEWGSLIAELLSTDRITDQQAKTFSHLTIVGMVGSIDNDMASTDITIGAASCLHRVCEMVDSIGTTASSHSRAFVIEVMGRDCGWVAMMAAIATGADFVFIPEQPLAAGEWQEAICDVAHRHREMGKRKTVIIVAEGALDSSLNPVKSEDIKNILTERLGLDTRVTILGHIQRGGTPCAFDRILATTQSVAAVEAVLQSTPDMPSPFIGYVNNKVTSGPLMDAVALTHQVADAIHKKEFDRAMQLRDPQFRQDFTIYNATSVKGNDSLLLPSHRRLRFGIVHVGAPAAGMNAATRTVVRYALNRGHVPVAISNGFDGLLKGALEEMTWIDVDGWSNLGGSHLGTNRHVPGKHIDMGMLAYQMQRYELQGLVIVGGFEAYSSLLALSQARDKYPSLRVPLCVIPATISNNVPGTDYSLGCDTSLNMIVNACDAITQSARSSRRRVFVVEVQGGRSGFLAVQAGLASGANTVYIPEEGVTLDRIQSDVHHLMALYLDDDADRSEGRIVLRNETASDTYTTDVISNIFKEEGHALFDSRTAVLGHVQQGGAPSPLDRIRANTLGFRAVQFLEKQSKDALNQFAAKHNNATDDDPVLHTSSIPVPNRPIELCTAPSSAAIVGFSGSGVRCISVDELIRITDVKNRKPKSAWWYVQRPFVDLLAGRGLFTPEAQALHCKDTTHS